MLHAKRPKMVGGYKRLTDNVFLPKTRISNTTFIDHPKCFNIANNVFIGHHNFIESSHKITIEEGCQLTNFITLTTHSSHNAIRYYGANYSIPGEKKGYIKGSIFIGKYSFIGPHATIMPNTNIGKGSIVAAYSYVSGNFPDFSIISGNPAKVIGSTKKIDERFISRNPELLPYYKEWASNE